MQISERINAAAPDLTTSERKLAATLLADYPFAGLDSIQELANRTEISAPSISRFVTKIGLSGYQEFQRVLIAELKEGQRSPVEVHDTNRAVEGGYLHDFIARAACQITNAGTAITEDQFDRICENLSDPRRKTYVIGGRISDTIAQHLSFHLRHIRDGVFHLPPSTEAWPEYLLRMRPGDLLFVVDFRRYQANLASLAEKASKKRGARIILMTDPWLSPIAKHAAEIMPVPIKNGTLWDTYSPALAVTEAIVTRIAEDNWDKTSARIQAWDALRFSEKDTEK